MSARVTWSLVDFVQVIGRVEAAQTAVALLEYELDALLDPPALEHAALAGASLTHLRDRLDDLVEAYEKEVTA